MRERWQYKNICSEVKFEENKIITFHKRNETKNSFRVQKDGVLGVHYQMGDIDEEEGYKKAEEKLALMRPYPFSLETGARKRDKTEREYTDKELLAIAKEALAHITEKYPQFTLSGSFIMQADKASIQNEKGLDYENKDCHIQVSISYKHEDSKDISDGYFSIGQRDFSMEKLYEMAENYLEAYEKKAELPEEAILQMPYYEYLGAVTNALNAEALALGTSLLSGKLGQKVFSEDFTLLDDVTDENCWHTPFWDGDGCVLENDKRVFIENGVPLLGYSDKRIAAKYNVPHTGNARRSFTDIPSNGNVRMWIKKSTKTVKELLDGRYSIVLDSYSGGGFNEKGDYVMPVHHAFLCDGENFLGSLPPFTISSNMFDMFGKDYIGVAADQPVFNDKQILMKVAISRGE